MNKRLRNLLGAYAGDRGGAKLGNGRPANRSGAMRALTDEDRDRLREDLAQIQRANSWLVWVAAGMLAALFALSVWILWVHQDKPALATTVSGAIGLSAAGIVNRLLKLWTDKKDAETLLRLAVDLEGEALTAVIMSLSAPAPTQAKN